MNFLKNSFNKLFGKTEEPKASVPAEEKPSQVNEEADIPADALVDFFEITSQFISESKQPAPDSLKLQLYSYYKQATIGDCNTPKPAIYELVAKTKWESWSNLKGISAGTAMKHYIATAVQVDPLIPAKMASAFSKEEVTCEHHHHQHNMEREGAMMKMVKQQDYSGSYSHPYFKAIEKGQDLPSITRELLLQKNNSPKVFPLHFAIDKEREDLVPKFLELLSLEDIAEMKDEEGTGILEYAQLIENEAILGMIRSKLSK